MFTSHGKRLSIYKPTLHWIFVPETANTDSLVFTYVYTNVDVNWCWLTGLEEQGLYRVVGVSSKINKLTSMGLGKSLNQLQD